MAQPERQNTRLPFWTIDQATKHFGLTRAAVLRYIRDGLPSYFAGTMVKPPEFIAEYLKRRDRQRKTRAQ